MKNNVSHQPINESIDELMTTFESMGMHDPFKSDIKRIFNNPQTKKAYMDILMSNVSEESERELIATQIDNSLKGGRGMDIFGGDLSSYSEEGLDMGSSPAGNAGVVLGGLTPLMVLGYNAKSHMTDVFKTITHKDKKMTLTFKRSYVIGSEETDKTNAKSLPSAIRDGSIAGLAEPEKVVIVAASVDNSTVNGYIQTGKSGNFLVDSGKDLRDWSLAPGIKITGVLFDNRADQGTGSATQTALAVVARVSELQGDGRTVAEKMVEVKASLTLDDASVVEDSFIVIINRDTGAYRSTPSLTGRISDYKPEIELLNNVNAAATLRAGRDEFDVNLWTRPRRPMSQPLGEDGAMEDFVGDDGATGVAAAIKEATQTFTTAFAGINDVEQEAFMKSAIDGAIADQSRLQDFAVAAKLGGYAGASNFDLAKRGSGGDRPFSWYEEGIKDLMLAHIIEGEAATEFRNDTDREWMVLGFENDVRRMADIKYQTETEAGQTSRYGFVKEGLYAYTDNFQRRVKLIGTRDARHKAWGGSVYGFMKSNDWQRQPTGVYFSHSFKVVRGRDPRNLAIDAILFKSQDMWDICALNAVRLTLQNNGFGLYSSITTP